MELKELLQSWVAIKEQEREVIKWRRDIEDQLVSRLQLGELENNVTKELEGFKVVACCRVEKKVCIEAVNEVASAYELQSHLDNLFRWKAEVNSMAWKKADPLVIQKFEAAITTRIGKPSFKIEEII